MGRHEAFGEVVEFGRGRLPGHPWALSLQALLRPAEARSFAPRAVSREVLAELHALMALSPGLAEASPVRVLFLASEAAKARLVPWLSPAERAAAQGAPACAVIGYDAAFAEQLAAFVDEGAGPGTALKNGLLQGAYLAVAARALGLEAAFVASFDRRGVAGEFFPRSAVTPTFVARLGYPA